MPITFLSDLELGPPVTVGGLAVVPLTGPDAPGPAYLVLDDALETGRFSLEEISQSGSVPEIVAVNRLDVAVLIIEGEQIVGAKQNRTLNLSVLVPPHSKVTIPVTCVEQGRWSAGGGRFRTSEFAHFAQGRARKAYQVSESLQRFGAAYAEQDDVWETISAKAHRMAVNSPTGAMEDTYRARRIDLAGFLDGIRPGPGQRGAVFVVGRRPAGLEVFDRAETFARLARKLVASYALDALEAEPADVDAQAGADDFIGAVRAATASPYEIAGLGTNLRLAGDGVVGAALVAEAADGASRAIHAAAFANDDDGAPGRPSRPFRRRRRDPFQE